MERSFTPVFVEFIPEVLESDRLYVSMEFGAVAHLCACGCGTKVDTPLTPTDWKLEYDGVAVSLRPSVGSWSLPCRSHYFITKNRVRWSESWSEERIQEGREYDSTVKRHYYDEQVVEAGSPHEEGEEAKQTVNTPPKPEVSGLLARIRSLWPW